MDRKMAQDLDKFITGHYGEDQFKDGVEPTCSNCKFLTQDFTCPTCLHCKFPTQDFTCTNCKGKVGTVVPISHDGWCENWAEEEI